MDGPRPMSSMPGPWEPASLQAMLRLTRPDFYQRMADRYGPVFHVRMAYWGDLAVFTTSLAAQQILKLPRSVVHGGMDASRTSTQRMQEAMGMGPNALLLLNGGAHQRMRKLLMPPLMGSRLARWESFIEELTSQVVDGWPLGTPFAIRPVAERITLDVIAKVVFGVRDTAGGRELRGLLPALVTGDAGTALTLMSPLGRFELGGWSPLGRFRRKRDRIDELLYAEIASRRGEPDDDRADLLSALLLARDEHGAELTDAEVRDQLVIMLLAGHESSANVLAWTVERLVHNPRVHDRLLASLDDGDTTYLDAVVKETLRSRPISHEFTRVLAEDAVIDGWALPAGTAVAIAVPVLHHDPEIYPDPEEFRPERFLDGNEPDPNAWLPFGGGVRRCPGANLAMLELRVVLATMLRRVRLAPARPKPEKPVSRHLVRVPERGGRVIVTQRLAPRSGVRS